MLDEPKEKKWVVYRGSLYSQMRDPDALWVMSEYLWDKYMYHHSENATLLARGLTKEVATKMAKLAEENEDGKN